MSKTLEILNYEDKVRRVAGLISVNEPCVTVLGHDAKGERLIDSVLERLGGGHQVSIYDVDDLRQVHRDRRIDSVLDECEDVSNFLVIRLERRVGDNMLQALRNKARNISHQARDIGIKVIFVSFVNSSLNAGSLNDDMTFVGGDRVLYSADLAIIAKGEYVKVVKSRYDEHDFLVY